MEPRVCENCGQPIHPCFQGGRCEDCLAGNYAQMFSPRKRLGEQMQVLSLPTRKRTPTREKELPR